jgi:hypothetical protein
MEGSKGITVSRLSRMLSVLGIILGSTPLAMAGPIAGDTWYEFGFSDPFVPATGLDPADPAGPFGIPSSGTPTVFLDAPPWTFLAPAGGSTLIVTDAFIAGDRFEIFDFGSSLGLTSVPVGTADCGDDPVPCLADPNISKGSFALAAGNHSLTIVPVSSPGGGGSAYFLVSGVQPVPEPGTILLFGLGLGAVWAGRRRRAGSRT